MLANSPGSKRKASKSSRDLSDTDNDIGSKQKLSVYDKGGDGDRDSSDDYFSDFRNNALPSKVYLSRERTETRPKSRHRSRDDFQMPQGSSADRRGGAHGIRGRGGAFPRRVERENDSNSTSRSKFQESLKGSNSETSLSSSSKYTYYSDVDARKVRLDHNLYNVPEDSRISKLLRRLSKEEEIEKFLLLCTQLQDSLTVADNARYIRRAFDDIASTLLTTFQRSPGTDCKVQASKCLGTVGYVLIEHDDFKRYMDWIFSQYETERNEIRLLLLSALLETVRLDKESPNLKDSNALIAQLQTTLENTDYSELVMGTVDVIALVTESYPNSFTKHFRDAVDILVGWHIDGSQSAKVLYYASCSLRKLSRFWIGDVQFTVNLLAQFLEDMEEYGDDLTQGNSGRSTPADGSPVPESSVVKISALIKVFNTVAKSMGNHLSPAVSPLVSFAFLTDSFAKMLTTVTKTLELAMDEDLIVTANECSVILLTHLASKVSPANQLLYKLIGVELEFAANSAIGDSTVVSMLQVVVKTIREVSGNLPMDFVQNLLAPTSPIIRLRLSASIKIQNEILSIYLSLLNLKNIPLLQEVYRHVLGDLDRAYRQIVPSIRELCPVNPYKDVEYSLDEAELTTLFYLRTLTDLANATNSIIGMWALNPSILELLAKDLSPADPRLGPALRYALLYLLHSHCSKSNNFVSSCRFVTTQRDRANVCDVFGLPSNLGPDAKSLSPTSGHFVTIVDLLRRLIATETCDEVRTLVLAWSREVFLHAEPFAAVLGTVPEVEALIDAVVAAGNTTSAAVALRVAENIEQLLAATGFGRRERADAIVDVCLLHLHSPSAPVRRAVQRILSALPWDATLSAASAALDSHAVLKRDDASVTFRALRSVCRHHIAREPYGAVQAQHFRRLMGHLLHGGAGGGLRQTFCAAWPLQASGVPDRRAATHFGAMALSSTAVLAFWATWEAAQLCVVLKLRTPLGKPQDTFTSVEAAVKTLAREIGQDAAKTERDAAKTDEPNRVRLLLDFVEHLEKAMYNAGEGCAATMLQPAKPVRTFFHTNKSTCAEWLARIRMAVAAVAARSAQATVAVRHGHHLLQACVDGGAANGAEFQLAAMYVCWALCRLGESAAILGLYSWCRDVSGRKFAWLKAAAHHAAGRLETAVDDYRKILEQASPRGSPAHDAETVPAKTNKAELDPQVIGFISDQLSDCLVSLRNWSDLYKWKSLETELWSSQNGCTPHKYLTNAVTADHAKALAEFEAKDFTAASELMKWPSESQLPDTTRHWNANKLFAQTNAALTSVALNLAAGKSDTEETVKWKEVVETCAKVSHGYLRDAVKNPPSEFFLEAMVLKYAAVGLQNLLDGRRDRLEVFAVDGGTKFDGMNTSLLTRVLWWSECFEQLATTENGSVVLSSSQLQLEVVKVARKEGNLGLAQKLMLRYLERNENIVQSSKRKLSLEDVGSNAMKFNICSEADSTWDLQKVRAYTEMGKLLYVTENVDKAVDICVFTSLSIAQSSSDDSSALKERSARLLVTLSKWLQEKRQGGGEIDVDNWLFVKLIDQEKAKNNTVTFNVDDGPVAVPAAEIAIGHILQLACGRCPELAKTWGHYAAWCYRWGKRVVETPLAAGQLSDVDRNSVQQMMPRGTTLEELETVTSILSRTRSFSRDEDIEGEDINTSETIKSQLATVRPLAAANDDALDCLVDVWRAAQKRVFSYYQQAATAYFKYLAFCDDKGSNECNTIMATLRLLRMIVKHAMELQDVLETGLAATPTRPWKVIIPQLFSRLSHPEPYVRTRVSELLCRVAEDAPHLITFPAVVGAAEGGAELREITGVSTSRLFSAGLSQPEDEEEEDEEDEDEEGSTGDEDVSVLKSCFLAMVDTLSKQAPLAIAQVQLVVSELHRITLLWDELWLGTLVQHHAEISRRLSQLEGEVYRVEDNVSLSPAEKDALIAEKYRIIMKPLVFILEQLHAITSVPPETPHEVWFQEKFNDYITDALAKLKSPADPRKPHDCWHPLKTLQSRLQHRAQKRAAYAIHMADVSPALATLRDTVIAMPGVTPSPGKIITVAAVGNSVTVLPTKTKPKKLVFHGNDGKTYTYLFKGLEDLHLDERIMQFLSIANTMLASERCGDGAVYQARHYSVIPLGPRSGLISWVEGVTPLFGLYKRWQQREVAAGSLKGTGSGLQSSSGVQVMRPSEMFYNKLTPLLKEKGVVNLDNRKEWPLPVLRQVLTELMDETPKDLLAKELWCHSVTAGDWWRTTRRYSYSVAVMSIIGYIIGLGDRHLDNVLVDLNTGEVVHIDYNVCFEKGKTLRVPEKVPFRMTQNIRAALGVTGVEGIFRLTCEHVLKVMKKGRETLLTLLEAFVYDPLIDWTPGGETGYTGAVYGGGRCVATETTQSRRALEREVTRDMFAVRVAEMRCDWLANRDLLLEATAALEAELAARLGAAADVDRAQEALQDCHQQMSLVKEAEAQGVQHPLFALAGRYAKHRRAKEALDGVRAALTDRVEDSEKLLVQHANAMASIRGPQLAAWVAEANVHVVKDGHLVFDLVKEFLQNAGQGPMVGQCEHSEAELGQLEQQQRILTRTGLDLLSQYKAVAGLYPASYINTHRAVCYRRWALYLLNNMSVESCQEVRAQFASLFSPDHPSSTLTAQQVIACSFQQQAILNDANIRLQKWYERLSVDSSAEALMRLDAAYLEAKAAISAFPRSEKGAVLALECVNVTALCALNKRYIMMETAAFCAGDSLVELTSRDGDWFLDEMYVVSTSITELASHIPARHGPAQTGADSRVPLVLRCIQAAHGIYKGLQELNFNFHMIILPEAVERIQAEEPTVLSMVSSLNETVGSVGLPLNELLGQLEMHLRCVVMEMESPHGGAQATVAALRARFTELTRPPADGDGEDRPGMMLLMGFNGLFEKLQKDGNALVAALDTLETPACWKKIDQVRDAKSMAAPVFNDVTRAILEDIFLIRRLQTMQEFFALCCQMALNTTVVHDDDRLMKPIRRYTADFVSRRLLGVTSQTLALALCLLLQRIGLNVSVEVEQRDVGAESKVSLEELCRKAVDVCLKSGAFGNAVLAQASGLTSGLEATWRRKEAARRVQQEMDARRSTLKRLHYQLTAYHWLHEDSLAAAQGSHANVLVNRPAFMLEMRQTCSALLSLQPRIVEALKQQSALVVSVEQRLKWAAGANPALMEVLAAFESALTARNARLAAEQRIAVDVGHVCTVLLHHEALRTRTSEGVGNDNAFMQLIGQCEASCVLAAGYDQSVTPVEESLVLLLPPEGNVDNIWIQNVERLIAGTVKSLQQQMLTLQAALAAAHDSAHNAVANVHSLFNTHHKLMADVRNLVKPMLKYEEPDRPGLPEFWAKYRTYADDFAALLRELAADRRDADAASATHHHLAQLRLFRGATAWIYQELLALGKTTIAPAVEELRRRPPLLRQESVCLSPRKGVPDVKKTTRDPHTGKAMQERNSYAVGVWRRVRTKFEGRDPDLGRKVSNQEQVDYVIREATNLDNLSLLYEGWTPWV